MEARDAYREVIYDNIEYEHLVQNSPLYRDQIDEIAKLIVDTVCTARKTIRIAGDDFPAEVVKSRFLKLDSSHVQYVMDCMKDNTTYLAFFKSRDADAITAAFQAFASKKISWEEKPSIREKLAQAKEQAAKSADHRTIDQEKVKVKDRSVQR